jgi:hypothetical protein
MHVSVLAGARCERSECRSEGNSSCHDEPFSHLLHPLSSVSDWLELFRLTRPHIALVSIAVASTAAAFTGVATTVVYAREWRSASALPLLVLQRSGQQPRALLPLSVVHTATIIMLRITAAYPRHSSCLQVHFGKAETFVNGTKVRLARYALGQPARQILAS